MNNLVLEYIITKEDVGKKFINILKNKMYISQRLLIKLKNERAIYFLNAPLFVNMEVKKEDIDKKIFVNLDKVDVEEKEKIDEILNNIEDREIDILYEDLGYICVNKPSNVAIHPCSNHRYNTMLEYVQKYMYSKGYKNKIHPVNRLDRETSGVCIFAKHAYFQENCEIWDKRYIAIVDGNVNEKGIIEKNIAREEGSIMLRCISEDGEYAKTEYHKLGYNEFKNYSVVDIKLYTGRTHQIRVHFKSIGHSLLGDGLYNLDINRYKYINRVALHSKGVKFRHKYLNKNIEIEANCPEDIERLIKGE